MSRTSRRARQAARQQQILQRYHKQRQRNVMAEPGRFPFAIVLDNLKPGYNVPKIFRSAQAFGAAEIHLVNIGPFDPAPAKGAFRKVPARFHENFSDAHEALRSAGYTLFMLTPHTDQTLQRAQLPSRSAFVFGHEEQGFSFDATDHPDLQPLAIPQFGNMDSLNVSVAASIVMYEYTRQQEAGSA